MKKPFYGPPTFRTQWNHLTLDRGYETNNDPSETVPDMALTIREILAKFSRGQSLPIGHEGQFEENPDMDNINPLSSPDFDLSDITYLQEQVPETIKNLKGRLKKNELSSAGLPDAPAVEDNGGKDGVKDGRQLI